MKITTLIPLVLALGVASTAWAGAGDAPAVDSPFSAAQTFQATPFPQLAQDAEDECLGKCHQEAMSCHESGKAAAESGTAKSESGEPKSDCGSKFDACQQECADSM